MEMEWGWGGRITGIKLEVIFLRVEEFFSFITRINATLCRGIIPCAGIIVSVGSAILDFCEWFLTSIMPRRM